jgi:hypothetical protein
LLRIQALRGFWRRSRLAPSLLDSISPTLVMLWKIIVMIQDMSLNSHSRDFIFSYVILMILYRNFDATKAIKTFSLRKNITLRHLAVLHENFEAS